MLIEDVEVVLLAISLVREDGDGDTIAASNTVLVSRRRLRDRDASHK
jgi:hypothetical protein